MRFRDTLEQLRKSFKKYIKRNWSCVECKENRTGSLIALKSGLLLQVRYFRYT